MTRTAVICCYAPEMPMLEGRVNGAERTEINGLPFVTGELSGQPVVLMLTGMSLVNAAMATQLVLDRFTVGRIVVCGIAGGADPDLHVGDVVVPAQWALNLEATMARELPGGGFGPDILDDGLATPNFGALFPHAVEVRSARGHERKAWFEVDPALLDHARALDLPGVHVGGSGVSSSLFVDNAAYCRYLFETFAARAVDIESAAIAQVAYANAVPFIAVRGLTDRAGAEEGLNTALLNLDHVAERSAAVVEALLRRLH